MNNKQINSYFGVALKSCVIEQNSNVLAVLLPGIGYTNDRPLMDYSKKLCIELGYDVLPIEYGFQAARVDCGVSKNFDIIMNENFNIIFNESKKILELSLTSKYKEVIFIGKSFGTIIQYILCNSIDSTYKVSNICLTPVNKTVEMGIRKNSLVISGTKDPFINADNSNKLKEMQDMEVIFMDGCDHSLNIGNNIISSIDCLKNIISYEKNYLINRY